MSQINYIYAWKKCLCQLPTISAILNEVSGTFRLIPAVIVKDNCNDGNIHSADKKIHKQKLLITDVGKSLDLELVDNLDLAFTTPQIEAKIGVGFEETTTTHLSYFRIKEKPVVALCDQAEACRQKLKKIKNKEILLDKILALTKRTQRKLDLLKFRAQQEQQKVHIQKDNCVETLEHLLVGLKKLQAINEIYY